MHPKSSNEFTKTTYLNRHIGTSAEEQKQILDFLGFSDIGSFMASVIPKKIKNKKELQLIDLTSPLNENQALKLLEKKFAEVKEIETFIGQGFYPSILPSPIKRNILENPAWYTSYTPYQAEISQGRLEMLMNFQTMICELTGLDIANASLLDEASACAEAMRMALNVSKKRNAKTFIIDKFCHKQNLNVIRTHAEIQNIKLKSINLNKPSASTNLFDDDDTFAIFIQSPNTLGQIPNNEQILKASREKNILIIMAVDLLALTTLKSPGELGADIAIGSSGRFGLPMWFGGPHAAFIACKDEHKRKLPGRLVGLSKDTRGRPAYRLTLQAREQHIRRAKATSNICTAQSLPAIVATAYALYHGNQGLRTIAMHVHQITKFCAEQLNKNGYTILNQNFFDTLHLETTPEQTKRISKNTRKLRIELRKINKNQFCISFDESKNFESIQKLLSAFNIKITREQYEKVENENTFVINENNLRQTEFLTQEIFNKFHSETELMRYLRSLEKKDYSLADGMIPLGSCTMKLNAATTLTPVSWNKLGNVHPFTKRKNNAYQHLIKNLCQWLGDIVNLPAVSLQPNAGSQGELAGLLAIRSYHKKNGDNNRTICLVPESAHGTNSASAAMAGMQVMPVKCLTNGDVSLEDLRAKCQEHAEKISALMVTYPSTHGVFEEEIKEICQTVHNAGGQVYMDGANMNAQIGFTSPGELGADVCHLNLHKTFAIPHGGGGPGVGPIAAAEHLHDFLPGNPNNINPKFSQNCVCATEFGSVGILVVPWLYIAMLGENGLKSATESAILNANYIAKKLAKFYSILFVGKSGLCAHECIIDCRNFQESAGISVEDIAKRLIDYGFHAPTMSWPIPGTLMIEPTESEPLAEIERFCDAMIAIHAEITEIAEGKFNQENNPLKNAPHPIADLIADDWDDICKYSREKASPQIKETSKGKGIKYLPPVSRIDNAYGDRNLICTCDVTMTRDYV